MMTGINFSVIKLSEYAIASKRKLWLNCRLHIARPDAKNLKGEKKVD